MKTGLNKKIFRILIEINKQEISRGTLRENIAEVRNGHELLLEERGLGEIDRHLARLIPCAYFLFLFDIKMVKINTERNIYRGIER